MARRRTFEEEMQRKVDLLRRYIEGETAKEQGIRMQFNEANYRYLP